MKNFLVGGIIAAAVALAGGAQAADMRVKAPISPPPVAAYSWAGWYIGGNVGGAWGHSSAQTSTIFSPTGYFATTSPGAIAAAGSRSIDPSGATAGAQLGYNWQFGATVFGFETDFGYFGNRRSSIGNGIYPCCAPTGFTVSSAVKTDWLFTARPRLGFTADNWLFYVTGGLAVTELKANFTFTDTFATASESGSVSRTRAGWTAGAGIEWGVAGPWSVKLEYLHLDFGNLSGSSANLTAFTPAIAFPTNVFTHSVDLRSDLVRVGFNYRFSGNGGVAPLAARY